MPDLHSAPYFKFRLRRCCHSSQKVGQGSVGCLCPAAVVVVGRRRADFSFCVPLIRPIGVGTLPRDRTCDAWRQRRPSGLEAPSDACGRTGRTAPGRAERVVARQTRQRHCAKNGHRGRRRRRRRRQSQRTEPHLRRYYQPRFRGVIGSISIHEHSYVSSYATHSLLRLRLSDVNVQISNRSLLCKHRSAPHILEPL